MKYLGLAYFAPDKFAAMAPDDVDRLVSQCPALDEKMRATGKVLLAASLGDVAGWTTLRLASMHPAATLGEEGGWAVELIPIEFLMTR